MKRKSFCLLILCCLILSLSACGKKEEPEQTPDASVSGKYNIEIEIENYGTIALTLDADAAPITVQNFLKLTRDGFYNGLTFHRIINSFMMQGGAPKGTDSPDKIKGEFSANGIDNPISHVRGTISMARGENYDSASSQFFIVHKTSPHLDGAYAAFGTVTEGMDVVDAICTGVPTVDGTDGAVLPENQPIIKEIRIVE